MCPSLATAGASWPARPLLRSRLDHCVALALLLHLLLVIVLGSAPGGSARPGDGVWGRVGGVLDVRLTGAFGDDKAEAVQPITPITSPAGQVGPAKPSRVGGAVRSATAPETPGATEPGSAQVGRWSTLPGDAQAAPAVNRVTRQPQDALRPVAAPAAQNLEMPPMPTPLPTPRPVPEPVAAAEPAPTPPPLEAPAPAPVVEPVAAPVAQAATPPIVQPVAQPASTAAAPSTAATEPRPSPTATPTPVPAANPGASPYPAPAGSPDAGARLGRDVATPPSAPPSAQRAPLNLSLPRGPAVSRQGSSGLLQMMPHPPEKKSKLAEDIEAAAKADCRKAYSDAGLLAAVPLILDAARDKGCRW